MRWIQNGSIEDPDSNFNQHRLEVIRYVIERNLSIAIANYNKGGTTSFQMPNLSEDDWERVQNNVCIISFLQGLSIGGKIYNGYAIVSNNKNQEVVAENSIYIVDKNAGRYHQVTDSELPDNSNKNYQGFFNLDFERKTIVTEDGKPGYFMPQESLGCYSCVITRAKLETPDNIYKYVAGKKGTLATAYFTALGRERYSMYKSNRDPDMLKQKFGVATY